MGDGENLERQTWTVDEAARILGVCRGVAYALANSGQLPVIRAGRKILVPKAALAKMLSGDVS